MKIFNADIHSLLLVIFFGGLQGLRVSCALDLGEKVLIDMEKRSVLRIIDSWRPKYNYSLALDLILFVTQPPSSIARLEKTIFFMNNSS